MTKIFTSFLTLLVFVNLVIAQKTTTPTVKTKSNDFVSKEGGFRVKFPFKPTKKVMPFEAAFGKTTLTIFEAVGTSALFAVSVTDFPTIMDDKEELNIRFDNVRDRFIQTRKTKLVQESEVALGEFNGRHLIFDNQTLTVNMRLYVIQQRFFQLTVVTRSVPAKGSAKLKAANQKLVDNFMNSFEITELPTPKTEAVRLPADFGISFENSGFKSKFFGFTMTLPENWTLVEKDEVTLIREFGKLEDTGDSKKEKLSQLSDKNTEILGIITNREIAEPENYLSIIIAAEKVSFPNFLPKAMLEGYLKTFVEPNEKVSKPITAQKINNVEFYWIELSNMSEGYKRRLFIANRQGIAFEIMYFYRTEQELQLLQNILNSATFEENQLNEKNR